MSETNKLTTADLVPVDSQIIGRCFVWEPLKVHATAMVVVVSVSLNVDKEWWIETADLVTGKIAWNELSRFEEATKLTSTQIHKLLTNR
jgi:hypothetical protein